MVIDNGKKKRQVRIRKDPSTIVGRNVDMLSFLNLWDSIVIDAFKSVFFLSIIVAKIF